MDDEIRSVQIALKYLSYTAKTFSKSVILCDSKAAITATSNYTSPPSSRDVLSCRKMIKNETNYQNTT